MKIDFVFKDPGSIDEGINSSGVDEKQAEEIFEMVRQYIEYGEYVTLQLDTDTGIMSVKRTKKAEMQALVYELEKYLIPPEKWVEKYHKMPPECKQIVDQTSQENDAPIAIGYCLDKGWFVLSTQQGPFVAWKEWK